MIIIISSVKGQRTSHLHCLSVMKPVKICLWNKIYLPSPTLGKPATETMNKCKSFLGTTAAQILWCSESACASKSANWWLEERDEELEEKEDEQQWWQQQQEEEEAEEDENEEEDEGQGEEKEKRTRRNTEERMRVLTLENHATTRG